MTLEEIIQRIKRLKADIPNPFSSYLAEILAPDVKSNVKEIFDKWVNDYYNSYSPKYYKRTNGLKNAYICELCGDTLEFRSNADLLGGSHRVSNEYIYDHMFFEGWHGGAISGPNHPNPGNLYWRTPYKEYTRWGSIAASSAAPGPHIQSEIRSYFNSGEWHKKVQNTTLQLAINKYGL